jgi:hypothetical protein
MRAWMGSDLTSYRKAIAVSQIWRAFVHGHLTEVKRFRTRVGFTLTTCLETFPIAESAL